MFFISFSRDDFEFLLDSLQQTVDQSQILVKNQFMMMRLSAADRKKAFDRLNRQISLLDELRNVEEIEE